MKRALVIGASGGIGSAMCAEFTRRGYDVVGVSRSLDGLDVTDEASVAEVLGRLEGPFEVVFNATGALEVDGAAPEKSVRQLDAKAMADQFAVNCIGPALVLKHAAQLLPKDGRSVMAVLSARVGSIGDNRLGGWHSYRAAKAAVNQIVRGTAIELGRTHKDCICVALHPGTVATEFTRKYLGRHPAVEPEVAAARLVDVIEGLQPAQSGGFYDYAMKEIPW